MRWYPKLEIYNGGWETLPRDSFFDRVEVDKSTGEATVARFTIKREYTPENPLDWMARQVRISMVIWEETEFVDHLLFDGLMRRPSLDVVAGTVQYECATVTAALIGSLPELHAQLVNEVPWSDAVFGKQDELSQEEQFEKMLSASPYKVVGNELREIRADIAFGKDIGEELNAPSSYQAYHRSKDVIARVNAGDSINGAISVDITDPSMSSPAGSYGANGTTASGTGVDPASPYASLPLDATKPAPLNEVVCIVRHRYKRLVQEAFTYTYTGGNLYYDHGVKGAWHLTKPAYESAMQSTGLHIIRQNVEPAPPSQDLGDINWVAEESVRFSLVQSFLTVAARRYIQDCEMVYKRVYRDYGSINRYGVKSETREVLIEDKNDYSKFTKFELLPKFENSEYFEIKTYEDYAALATETLEQPEDGWSDETVEAGIEELGLDTSATEEEAVLATDTLVAQASNSVETAHSTSGDADGATGANRTIVTTYTIQATPTNLELEIGMHAAIDTSHWKIAGIVTALVYTLTSDGAALIEVTLTTSIAPGEPVEVPPVYDPETGKWIDPLTGAVVDPDTGALTDPVTGDQVNPVTSTGAPVPPEPVPSVMQPVPACVGYDGNALPRGGIQV